MADDGSAQSTAIWPMPKFYFEVKWDSEVLSFQEVSGLDVESQPIEYRHGDSPVFSTIKMPGLYQYSNITMKKGVFKSDNKFWDWFNQIKMNTIKRIPVTVSLLDETGEHPAVLRGRVTSPGGTTIAGLAELEGGGLRATVFEAVRAATRRSRELAEEYGARPESAAERVSSPRMGGATTSPHRE